MSRLTTSPALKVFLLQPRPAWVTGFQASSTHCLTAPLSSFASTLTSTCGFVHTYSVTVPVTVTDLPTSKDAAPWWANTGTANPRPTINTTIPNLLAMNSSNACATCDFLRLRRRIAAAINDAAEVLQIDRQEY